MSVVLFAVCEDLWLLRARESQPFILEIFNERASASYQADECDFIESRMPKMHFRKSPEFDPETIVCSVCA